MNAETFLKTSSAARRIGVDARIVIRRFSSTPKQVAAVLEDGTVEIDGPPICELTAGEIVLARGEIRELDGVLSFVVTEVVE